LAVVLVVALVVVLDLVLFVLPLRALPPPQWSNCLRKKALNGLTASYTIVST